MPGFVSHAGNQCRASISRLCHTARHSQTIHALQMKTWTPEQWEAKGKPESFE